MAFNFHQSGSISITYRIAPGLEEKVYASQAISAQCWIRQYEKFVTRFISIVILAIGLNSCAQKSTYDTIVIQSKVVAIYDGKVIEGASIISQPLTLSSEIYTRGEATILELGNGRRAYLLLVKGDYYNPYYGTILNAFMPSYNPNRERIKSKEVFKRYRKIPYGVDHLFDYQKTGLPKRNKYIGRPVLVAFNDESNPASIFSIDVDKSTKLFGKRFDFGGCI